MKITFSIYIVSSGVSYIFDSIKDARNFTNKMNNSEYEIKIDFT
jgi:hypothetical protein